jgi:hypothetical protein
MVNIFLLIIFLLLGLFSCGKPLNYKEISPDSPNALCYPAIELNPSNYNKYLEFNKYDYIEIKDLFEEGTDLGEEDLYFEINKDEDYLLDEEYN